jgi:hypothetical protein
VYDRRRVRAVFAATRLSGAHAARTSRHPPRLCTSGAELQRSPRARIAVRVRGTLTDSVRESRQS